MRSLNALVAALLVSASVCAHAQDDPVILHEQASRFGTIVVTEDKGGVRTLRFGRAGPRQSVVKPGDPDYLALPYVRPAIVGLALTAEPRRMLVIGLGGGTLPMFLRKYYPHAAIDNVEIDPEVVKVAKHYFGFREDPRMTAHVGDGRQFIEQVRRPYDVIFLDAFGSESLPAHLTTREFLHSVRRAVKASGVVVGNLWGPSSNPLYAAMVRTYQEVFDELFILEVRGAGNKILLALPRKQPLDSAELTRRARAVADARRMGFDLGEYVDFGFLHARSKDLQLDVLRDRDVAQSR